MENLFLEGVWGNILKQVLCRAIEVFEEGLPVYEAEEGMSWIKAYLYPSAYGMVLRVKP